MFKKMCLVSLGLIFMISSYALANIEGAWYTKDDAAIVEIYKDSGSDLFNGKIVWLKEPKNDDGTDITDNNNPDPAKRSQKRLGLEIVKDFEMKSDNKLRGGKIYDPENGKTYSCMITLTKNNLLKVRGFIGVSVIGRTEIWTKAENIPAALISKD
ncbi:MAG: DUF2147 domain-containing protein [Elusimicrobiota bacterium]